MEPTAPHALQLATLEDGLDVGSRVTLAGYGLTEKNEIGDLWFVTEAIVSMDSATIMVDGRGRSGACTGDSGGPLLIRDDTGQGAVLGILSRGAPNCTGLDEYLRVDVLRPWVEGLVGTLPTSTACGAMDSQGACYDGLAVWCDEGILQSETCSTQSPCGYVTDESGYRCAVDLVCSGGIEGVCDGELMKRCGVSGEVAVDCAACGRRCGYDPQTGAAACID